MIIFVEIILCECEWIAFMRIYEMLKFSKTLVETSGLHSQNEHKYENQTHLKKIV